MSADTRLWKKAWRDTRARFVIGLAVLLVAAGGIVVGYDEVQRQVRETNQYAPGFGADIADYRSYIWLAGFRGLIRQLMALFAVVIAAGGLFSQTSRGGGLFMLSLPVSRAQLLWSRVGVGLAQLAALTFLPPLFITALSPAFGRTYAAADALVHGLCFFIGGALLFSATAWLSTIFNDIWRPPLLALCGVVVAGFVLTTITGPGSSTKSLLGMMTGELWFAFRQLPVGPLSLAALASGALLYRARMNIARLDF